MPPPAALPIDALLAQIVETLRRGSRLVLRAAPGAGKTTRVPAALLDAGLAGDKQVLARLDADAGRARERRARPTPNLARNLLCLRSN